jgi:hypothetical protein
LEAKTIVAIALVVFMIGAGIWLKTRKKNK